MLVNQQLATAYSLVVILWSSSMLPSGIHVPDVWTVDVELPTVWQGTKKEVDSQAGSGNFSWRVWEFVKFSGDLFEENIASGYLTQLSIYRFDDLLNKHCVYYTATLDNQMIMGTATEAKDGIWQDPTQIVVNWTFTLWLFLTQLWKMLRNRWCFMISTEKDGDSPVRGTFF